MTEPLPGVEASGETVPVAGSQDSALPVDLMVTEWEMGWAPSLKKK